MDFISILATIILFTTVSTLVVAVAAYGAYKLRERQRRKPAKKGKAALATATFEPIFLEPYVPDDEAPAMARDLEHNAP